MAQYGLTPLHRAAQCGKEIAIKALLTAKADVHAKTDVRVGEGGVSAWRARQGGVGSALHYCGLEI